MEQHRHWWKNNWMAFAMFASVLFTNVWNGTDWLHARAASEVVTRSDIQRLETVLNNVPATYVRQDVFYQVLIEIRDRLRRIEESQKNSGRP